VLTLSLCGCAEVDSVFNTLDDVFGVMKSKDELRRVCDAVMENRDQAEISYRGRIVEVEAQYDHLRNSSYFMEHREDPQKSYRQESYLLDFTVEKNKQGIAGIYMVGETIDRKSFDSKLVTKQKVEVRGNISGLEKDGKDCVISLIRTRVSPLSVPVSAP